MAVDQRTTGWNARYSFSGKERDRETGLSYFGARYYDSDLSIWLSVDPLADKLPHQSPYVYCSNNPIGRVDPDGMLDDDYFNQYGKYLGSDNSSTDKVRIIKQETWDQVKDNISYKGNDGSTVISSGAANAISQDASGADLSDRSALNIYQHYNPTDYNLIVGNGDYNMQTRAKDQLIAVNLKKNKGLKTVSYTHLTLPTILLV